MTAPDPREVAAKFPLFRMMFYRDRYYLEPTWRFVLVWRPRPDLTAEGALIACDLMIDIRFRLPFKFRADRIPPTRAHLEPRQ